MIGVGFRNTGSRAITHQQQQHQQQLGAASAGGATTRTVVEHDDNGRDETTNTGSPTAAAATCNACDSAARGMPCHVSVNRRPRLAYSLLFYEMKDKQRTLG